MTKQWLRRRAVRSPFSRSMTAPMSSSVCSEPFISAAARPSRTSCTARSAAAWLCAASTISQPEMSRPACSAAPRMRAAGPTRRGASRPSRAASTAPVSDDSSQGCATAVLSGGRLFAIARSRSYFSCRRPCCQDISIGSCTVPTSSLPFIRDHDDHDHQQACEQQLHGSSSEAVVEEHHLVREPVVGPLEAAIRDVLDARADRVLPVIAVARG